MREKGTVSHHIHHFYRPCQPPFLLPQVWTTIGYGYIGQYRNGSGPIQYNVMQEQGEIKTLQLTLLPTDSPSLTGTA